MADNRNFEILKNEIEKIGLSYSVKEHEEILKIICGIQIEELKIPFSIIFKEIDMAFIAELPIRTNSKTIESSLKNVNKVNVESLKYGKYEIDVENNTINYTNFIYTKGMELPEELIRSFLLAGIYALDKFAVELQKDLL